jgi:hypothetical protein
LDLLGFIRPKRGFSVGYAGKNKKFPSPFSPPAGVSQDAGSVPQAGTDIARFLFLQKKMLEISDYHPRSGDSDRIAMR